MPMSQYRKIHLTLCLVSNDIFFSIIGIPGFDKPFLVNIHKDSFEDNQFYRKACTINGPILYSMVVLRRSS